MNSNNSTDESLYHQSLVKFQSQDASRMPTNGHLHETNTLSNEQTESL